MRAADGEMALTKDDADLIERSWQDPEQFAGLFDRHAPRIHRYIARRVGPDVSDDLLAETFLAAFAKRRGYDLDYRSAAPWLYGIATNLVGQQRRDEARQLRIRHSALPDLDAPGHADQVAADVTAESLRAMLATAVVGLPAAERDVLLLVAWEQLTYEEVATALGIPVGTVRSRLSRARTRLRAALADGPAATIEEFLSHG
jgi:RNA polymerase sigma factor (sigma-70 family)